MIDLKFLGRMGITMALAGMVCLTTDTAGAIDVELDDAAVKKAVEDGKQTKEIKAIPWTSPKARARRWSKAGR